VSPWWPWAESEPPPAPRPAAQQLADRVELTPLGELVVLRALVDQADAVLKAALDEHGRRGAVPVDVLLDIRLALHPVELRPPVPVIPGPDGARHA
jgi:hypothetical protein